MDVYGVAGVVLDFQTVKIELAVVNDPSTRLKVCPQNFRVGHHSTSVYKLKKISIVVVWLTSDCAIALRCRLFRFGLGCGVWRFTVGVHHLVSQLFQFHRIAALVINTVPTPFPFPTACQLHKHCQQ